MRVVVSQFATSSNTQENLASCIRMINKAAVCEPSLIVLPEFCNTRFCHAQPGYMDHNQAWNEALAINGNFLQVMAEQAIQYKCYLVLNVTLRRDLLREHQDGAIKSNITVTSCLFSPFGELIHQHDKQTLIGHEKNFFTCTVQFPEVVTTPFGELGFLMGCDGITFKASRELALHGAQLLCNSMNSFSIDQSSLHDPARACENKVFIASANKVGSLIPPELDKSLSEKSSIPQHYLVGVGQSQIVSPDGKVLAKITHNEEGFAFADIDLAELAIGINKKCRPDGTELIKQRRPELYQTLSVTSTLEHMDEESSPQTINVAIFATYKPNEEAIEDVCHYIENNLSDIIQLPELFFVADKKTTNNADQLAQIACLSNQMINRVSSVLRPFQYVCTSLVIEGIHQAVLISEQGLFATQQQLHFCNRYQWTALGDEVNIIKLPLEQGNINLAMLTADDANIPEIVKVVALNNIHLLLVPFDIQEPCEVDYSLLSRASENRICIVAASREKSFANNFIAVNADNKIKNKNKVKLQKSTGFIANLTTDSTLSTLWKSGKFTGTFNQPIVKEQHGKITKALIHPIATSNKMIAKKYS
jgi:predicted amidohydrolase